MPDQDEEFTSVCQKNASWIPDPVSQCTALSLRSGNHCPVCIEFTIIVCNTAIIQFMPIGIEVSVH